MTPVWLALRLPSLALEAHAPVPSPSAIVEHGRVVIGDAAAQAAGVAPGTGVAAARALSPAIALLARDRPREAAALRALACWAGKLTSRVAVLTDGLLLEVGTCLRLFGGLETLYTLVLSGATAQGFSVVAATAPTPLAAEWLARWRPGMRCAADRLKACLDDLPVEALPGEAATALGRFGLRTLGEVRRLPSAALSRRVGEESLRQLGRAYGECVDPRPDFVFPERFAQALTLPAPVDHAAALLFAARRLSAALSGWLAVRQSGVREVAAAIRERGEAQVGAGRDGEAGVQLDAVPGQATVPVGQHGEQRETGAQVFVDHVGAPHLVRAAFAQAQQASGMVDLAVHQDDCADAGIAQGAARLHGRKALELRADIRRGIAEHPVHAIVGDRDGRLGTRVGPQAAIAKTCAVHAVAVPLREATAGGGT